jgi:hypothetical protein
MDGRSEWTCSYCGAANKGFSQVCLGCSREKSTIATRGVILAAVGALILGLGFAVLLVRTFRSPRLDRAMAEQPAQQEERPRTTPPPPSTVAAAPSPSSLPAVVYAPPPVVHTLPVPPGAARPSDPTRDPRYILALREKRVDELRTRLASAHSRDERAALSVWLDDALRDLSEARRDF